VFSQRLLPLPDDWPPFLPVSEARSGSFAKFAPEAWPPLLANVALLVIDAKPRLDVSPPSEEAGDACRILHISKLIGAIVRFRTRRNKYSLDRFGKIRERP
jgi:hypothetical protein